MAWGLLIIGCLFGVSLVMIEAPSPMLIAVGMYLPLETTGAIFLGGVMKWLADQWAARRNLSGDEKAKFEERGTLLASGFTLLSTLFSAQVLSRLMQSNPLL